MADSTAPAPPTDEVANLHLDEVTGERVSKTELKKRQKQRQKEAEKAAKAAAAPPKASGKPKNAAGEEEKDLNPNQYYEIRTRHINERMLRFLLTPVTVGYGAGRWADLTCKVLKNPETNPYPHKFQVTYDDSKFFEEFGHLKSGETAENKEIRIAGRIYNKRASGSKLIFYGTFPRPAPPLTITTTVLTCPFPSRHPHVGRHSQHRHAAAGGVPGAAGQGGRAGVREAAREHPARRRDRHCWVCRAHQPQESHRRGQGGRTERVRDRDCAAQPVPAHAAQRAVPLLRRRAEGADEVSRYALE
jgi:lysyl-tRNA synthetase class 2